MDNGEDGAKAHGFTPKVSVPERHPVQFKDPTLSIWLSKVWLSTFQLTTVAGAAVVAKSAVAPLERVKVSPARAYDNNLTAHCSPRDSAHVFAVFRRVCGA